MPTVQELEQALISADKAGDIESAKAIASDMTRLFSSSQQQKTPIPIQQPINPAAITQANYKNYKPEEQSILDKTLMALGNAIPGLESQDLKNAAGGLSTRYRSLANLVSPGLGEKIWPTQGVNKESGLYKTGEFFNPVDMAIAGGVMKALPYAPMTGQGVSKGIEALGSNLRGGAVMGGALSALTPGSDMKTDVATGAAANVILPPVLSGLVKPVGWLAGKVRDISAPALDAITRGTSFKEGLVGRQINDLISNLSPERYTQVMDLMKNAVPGQTVAQAVAPAGITELAGIQSITNKQLTPTELYDVMNKQAKGMLSDIGKISKGPVERAAQEQAMKTDILPLKQQAINDIRNTTQTYQNLGQLVNDTDKSALTALRGGEVYPAARVVSPEVRLTPNYVRTAVDRERPIIATRPGGIETSIANPTQIEVENQLALARENAGKGWSHGVKWNRHVDNAIAEAATGKVLEDKAKELVGKRNFAQYLFKSMEGEFKPIETTTFISAIDDILKRPSVYASTDTVNALNKIKSKITEMSRNGLIDPEALATFKTQGINGLIEDVFKGKELSAAKASVARVAGELKPIFDEAMNNAGGSTWKTFNAKWSDGMRKVDEMAIGKDLGAKLKGTFNDTTGELKDTSAFMTELNRLRTEKDETDKFLIDKLSPENRTILNNVEKQIQTNERVKLQAAEGANKASKYTGASVTEGAQLPQYVDKTFAFVNKVLRALEGHGSLATDKMIADLTRDPKAMAKVMETANEQQKRMLTQKIAENMRNSGQMSTYIANQNQKKQQ